MTVSPIHIIHEVIHRNGFFPNNPKLPLLIYKKALPFPQERDAHQVEDIFLKSKWKNLWNDGIYPFHHYHSNTHEVLGIYSGTCQVQMGGYGGKIFILEAGDVIVIPVGVSHKNHECSNDFKCIGAYPTEIHYDMNYGEERELTEAEKRIKNVLLPETDPVYGINGPLFTYWMETNVS